MVFGQIEILQNILPPPLPMHSKMPCAGDAGFWAVQKDTDLQGNFEKLIKMTQKGSKSEFHDLKLVVGTKDNKNAVEVPF